MNNVMEVVLGQIESSVDLNDLIPPGENRDQILYRGDNRLPPGQRRP